MLNAVGELVGINFDRVWEGTMSDIVFDPDYCRNISIDIRYLLFIIERVGGAGWLLEEMDFAPNGSYQRSSLRATPLLRACRFVQG